MLKGDTIINDFISYGLFACVIALAGCAQPPQAQDRLQGQGPEQVAASQSIDNPITAEQGLTEALENYAGPPEDDPSWTETLTAVSRKKTKMIGGDRAGDDEWPYLGVFRGVSNDEIWHFCGATAISNRWVLTAAHCVAPANKAADGSWVHAEYGTLEVAMGVNDLQQTTEETNFKVVDVVVHPDYVAEVLDPAEGPWQGARNDIAIVELDRDWPGPIMRLSAGHESDVDQYFGRGFTAGFGVVDTLDWDPIQRFAVARSGKQGLAGSRYLNHAMLPLKSSEYCEDRLGEHGFNASQNICAAFEEGGIDTCQGDSGGPLAALDKKGRAYQVGVVSFGDGCAIKQKPGAYARISHYRTWITENVIDAIFVEAEPETIYQVSSESMQAIVDMIEPSGSNIEISILPSNQLKDGDIVSFEVVSQIPGRLWIFSRSADGAITPLFPTANTAIKDTIVEAGQTIRLPESDYVEYTGTIADADVDIERSELIAMVYPEGFELIGDGIPQITKSVGARTKRVDYPARLRSQIKRAYEGSEDADSEWGAVRVSYVITR